MNEYEMVVLLHPDLEMDVDKPLKKIEKIIKDNGGKIAKTDNWGKRKLAYQIQKQDHAIYVVYELNLEPGSIGKIESTLNITDEVIRYILVKPNPEIEEDEKDEKPKKSSTKEEKSDTEDKKEEKPKSEEE